MYFKRTNVLDQLVKMLITLEPLGNFDKTLLTNAYQHYLTPGFCNSLLLTDEGLLSIISAGCGQLVKCSELLNDLIFLDQILHTYLF